MGARDDPALTDDDLILERLVEFRDDLHAFILWAFPWQEPDTPLADQPGPDTWQEEEAIAIGAELRAGGDAGALIQRAIRAGHGVGKSAFVAMVIIWAFTTFRGCRGVVTAMTDTQLRTKTWAELSTWWSMFIGRHLFELTATSLRPPGAAVTEWRIDAVPWNDTKPAAFAGLHNRGKRILVVYDEASEISDKIWEVTEGALTDARTQIIWLALGNMTQTSGRFFKCFTSPRWTGRTIDSRTSRFSNKTLIARWIAEYGEDSDFVRVRVRGQPPRAGVSNFIGPELVFAARKREVEGPSWRNHPIQIGVDPARFGDDLSVIWVRQGAKAHRYKTYSGMDGPTLASRVVDTWREFQNVSSIAVDNIGIGVSCTDALVRVPGCPIVPVNVSLPAIKNDDYYNLRAELYGAVRKWLEHGELPDDELLDEELTAVNYTFDGKSRIQLESKQDVKDRIGRSPDRADGLALTFIADTMATVGKVRHAKALPVRRRVTIWSPH